MKIMIKMQVYALYLGVVMVLSTVSAVAQKPLSKKDSMNIVKEIYAVQDEHAKVWNTGNIEAFVQYYWQSDSVRFVSGGTVMYGVHALRERYKKNYPDKAAMGTLSFTDLAITVIDKNNALVYGRFNLDRTEGKRTGLFTIHLRKMSGVWRIMHDHTSV